MAIENTATIKVGEGVVVVKRSGASKTVIANILGTDKNADGGITKIYLDRIVHKPTEKQMGEWQVTGAISSVLYA